MTGESKQKFAPIEECMLYKLLMVCTETAMLQCLSEVDRMSKAEINNQSTESGNSFLHMLVQTCSQMVARGHSVTAVIPLIYKLVLHGIDVNMRNKVGNTCLHLSCIKPHCEPLWEHFIRVGVDPSLPNSHKCTVIHNMEGRACYQVKDQLAAKTGVWSAVEQEDFATVEKYMKCWVRCNVRRNQKSLREVCDGTGNTRVKSLLQSYEMTNELVCAAMACESEKVFKLAKDNSIDVNICDESYVVPKPLIACVQELGPVAKATVDILIELGANNDSVYKDDLARYEEAFEKSEFYQLVHECSRASLTAALSLLQAGKVDLQLKSFKPLTAGFTYLHYIAEKYKAAQDIVLRRQLVRCIYMLALQGTNVNTKDAKGETALLKAYQLEDQTLARHFLVIGVDASLPAPDGSCLGLESYLHKGRYVISNKHKRKDIPGVWVAAEDDDVQKAQRWLQSWFRVKVKKNGRYLKEIVKSKGFTEVHKLLEQHEHTNEFVMATFACDLYKMKMLIALGKRLCDVNPIDPHYLAGFRPDLSGEYVPRPLIIPAIEYCTAEVVEFLVRFGADLSAHYEECAPCGPAAFWAFHDDIDSEVSIVIANAASVTLRDELGHTLLHKAVLRKPDKLKGEIVQTLLDRKIDIGARDGEGFTARDYLLAMGTDISVTLMQSIDEHVVHKVLNDEYHSVEQLILASYDHVLDIKGHQRKKEAKMLPVRELAYLTNLQEMVELLDSYDTIRSKVASLQDAVKKCDLSYIAKSIGEKRLLQAQDRYGRSLLHLAILYGHASLVKFLIDQSPDLVKVRDNLLRTPVHYATASPLRRQVYGALINQAGGDATAVDANNLSVTDYLKQMESPTPKKVKVRGRQYYDYQVPNFLANMLQRDLQDLESPPTT